MNKKAIVLKDNYGVPLIYPMNEHSQKIVNTVVTKVLGLG